jgi:hypothetical protein
MAQKVTESIKEIKYASENLKDSISQKEIFVMPGTSKTASLLLSDAMMQIERARELTNLGGPFGITANLCVVLDAGLLSGDFQDWQVVPYIVGISSSLIRGGLSFATPNHLKKANAKLLLAKEMFTDDNLFEGSLKHLRTARRASIAVPLLGVTAWSLIPSGFIGIVLDSEANWDKYCYIAGLSCAVASLTCTFISSSHISKAKRSLQDDLGKLNLGMNKYGIGISYNF